MLSLIAPLGCGEDAAVSDARVAETATGDVPADAIDVDPIDTGDVSKVPESDGDSAADGEDTVDLSDVSDAAVDSEVDDDAVLDSDVNDSALADTEVNDSAVVDSEVNDDAVVDTEVNDDAVVDSEVNDSTLGDSETSDSTPVDGEVSDSTLGDANDVAACPGGCGEGGLCTVGTCTAAGTCTYAPATAGTPCGDDGVCTHAGVCAACLTDATCEDGDECTANTCDPVLGCQSQLVADGAACHDGTDVCVAGACQDCSEDSGATLGCGADAPFCVGGACVQCVGDSCGGSLTCTNGRCVGCVADSDCDDGVACTVDACDASRACTNTISDALCDDASFCTGRDLCRPASTKRDARGCLVVDAPVIDDGIACTLDSCDDSLRSVAHEAADSACDDGQACTRDVCQPGLGCAHPPVPLATPCSGGFCNDMGACAPCVDDSLHGVDSGCDAASPACDGARCTACAVASEACPPDCLGVPGGAAQRDNCGTCDADPTNNCVESCGGAACVRCDGSVASACDDHNPCTDDRCTDGICLWDTAARDLSACVDADACTVTSCSNGECLVVDTLACDGLCETGVCDALNGCEQRVEGSACDDGNALTLDETCNAAGQCIGACSSADGCVTYVPKLSGDVIDCGPPIARVGARCERDGNPCSVGTCGALGSSCIETIDLDCMQCLGAACEGQCRTGACTPGVGCQLAAAGTACDDGDPITGDDACTASGVCVGQCPELECGLWLGVNGACSQVVGPPMGPACPTYGDVCTLEVCTPQGTCEYRPRPVGELVDRQCGEAACNEEGNLVLVSSECPPGANPCIHTACNQFSQRCVSDAVDPTCDLPGATCWPTLDRCEADACVVQGALSCQAIDPSACGDNFCDSVESYCTEDCPERCSFRPCYQRFAPAGGTLGYAGTWRSFQSAAYGWPSLTSYQTESITRMLLDGIRWLHLIVDYCNPGTSSGPLCLCARDDSCPSASVPLALVLDEVSVWMGDNRGEILTLMVDDFVSDADFAAAIVAAGLDTHLYLPTASPGHFDQWPFTLGTMINHDQRLVIFGGGYLPRSQVVVGEYRRSGESDISDPNSSPFANVLGDASEVPCWDAEFQSGPFDDGRVYAIRQRITDNPGWAASACINARTSAYMGACDPDVILFNFYNSAKAPLEQFTGSSPYQDRCIDSVEGCLSDDECESGICGGLFICLTCANDADCDPTQHCDTTFGTCLHDLTDGALCLRDSVCQSGKCDLVCVSCDNHEDCGEGQWCDAFGGCQDPGPNGRACLNAIECASEICKAGYCAECDDQSDCDAGAFCNLDILPGESRCIAVRPNGDGCVSDFECATGNCHAATCTECDQQTDCPEDEFCTLDLVPPIESFCLPKKPNGESCGSNVECELASCFLFVCGECADDVDCGAAEHCDVGLQCAPDVGNNAPCLRDSVCTSGICSAGFCAECESHANCPTAEYCDLTGDCVADLANNAVCTGVGDAACITGLCREGFCAGCDGDGDCSVAQHCNAVNDCATDVGNNAPCLRDSFCASGICSAGFCAGCLSHADCLPSEHCNLAGDCVADLANNAVCTGVGNEGCVTGLCLEGFCAGCDGDAGCPANQHCNAVNDCATDVGNDVACLRDSFCSSGICSAGFCAECESHSDCPSAEHCNLAGDCVADLANNAVCTGVGNEGCVTGLCLEGFCAGCDGDAGCPANQHCNAVNDCAADVGNNAACLRSSFCTTGICSAGFCAECLSASDCESTEFCNAGGDCQTKLANDVGVCLSNAQCASGHCQGAPAGTCRQCTSHGHCPSDQHCNLHTGGNFRCAADLANNQTNCQLSDAYCQSGICDTTTCRQCVSAPTPEGCTSNQYCDSFSCVARKGEDATCATDAQCQSTLDCVLIPGAGNSQCRYPCSSQSTCTAISPAGSRWCNGDVCFDKFDNGYITCGSNIECKSGHCDGGMCVECTNDGHCDGAKPYCRVIVGGQNSCVACRNNSHCASNKYCSDSTFACVNDRSSGASCAFSGECTDQGPYSLGETCCVIRAGGNKCETLDLGQFCSAVE